MKTKQFDILLNVHLGHATFDTPIRCVTNDNKTSCRPSIAKKSSSEATRFEGIDNELLKLTFIATLSDSDVIKQLKRALFPQEIADKIDYLAAQIEQLKQTVKEKDEKIKQLESRVDLLESANDSIEQYSRRSNLRIEGIPESVGIGEIENAILDIVNDHMKLTSVLQSQRD